MRPPHTLHGMASIGQSGNIFSQEFADQAGNCAAILLQGEVPGIEQVKLDILQIALVRLRTFGREYLVVLAPDNQRGWLVLAEVSLPFRIERRV